ncbi:MAG: hypothetical protein K8L99_30070 [Anaerolineae bacterium]|nr:hypothetical protein [Anaerolineae bacterium]
MITSRIACPYCCTVQTFPEGNQCRECGLEVPEKYIRYAREQAPVYLSVVGMTAHGKTTLLNSLTLALDNIGKIARKQRAYVEALDDFTLAKFQDIRGQTAEREQTTSTIPNPGLQQPLVLSLNKFMSEGRQPVVIYDLAGEAFSDRAEIQEYAAPLKLAQTIWFIVSLHDLEHENTAYSSIADLFNVYITGMERAEANPHGRNLHVIYTKADKLTNQLDQETLEYLREDPYTNLAEQNPRELIDRQFDEEDYVYQMEQVDNRLLEYTEFDVTGGTTFVNMAQDYQMALSFSINTAIGRDHTPNNRMIDYRAYRVIDPLVWALRKKTDDFMPNLRPVEVDKPGYMSQVALILDTGFSSKNKIYGLELPSHLFTALSGLGEVATYYIGTLSPMTQIGYEPANHPPTVEYPPLIGPILDQLHEYSYILLVTSQTIVDLIDYHSSEWHERMAIVTFETIYEVRRNDAWPKAHVFDRTRTPVEQCKDIVDKLFYKSR